MSEPSQTLLQLLLENSLFLLLSTVFLGTVGWAWRQLKSYRLPEPLPPWFAVWFITVQIGGGVVPLGLLLWALAKGDAILLRVLVPYGTILGCQVLAESLSLRRFQSLVWVMVPYLYVPYRLWQLYEGLNLLPSEELSWLRTLLIGEMVLWGISYGLNLSQLPRLLHWPGVATSPTDS
jgi:hypothetical protein